MSASVPQCRNLLTEVPVGSAFILIRSGEKYRLKERVMEKGRKRHYVWPIGHTDCFYTCDGRLKKDYRPSLSPMCHVRIIKEETK